MSKKYAVSAAFSHGFLARYLAYRSGGHSSVNHAFMHD
jgi:hypothetical protein